MAAHRVRGLMPEHLAEGGQPGPLAYSIRPYDPRYEQATLALLRCTVGETAASRKTSAYWRWKHYDSPFGESYSVCAWDEQSDRLVGLRTLMWWSLRARDGTEHGAVRPVDTATHPDYRGRGVFSGLTHFAIDDLRKRGVSLVFNTPNSNSLPGYLKMGWRVVARWPLYVRPVRWLRTGVRALMRRRADLGTTDQPPSDTTGLVSWRRFRSQHHEDLAKLVSEHEVRRQHVGYRTVRTVPYLDWRYGAHPDITYGVHALRDSAGLTGAVVARAVRGVAGLEALLVTELLLRTPTPRAGARLLKSLLRVSGSDYLVAHFARATIERQSLIRAGFVRAPSRGYTFVARPLNPVPEDPTLPSSWDLTLGDLEIL